MNQLTKKLKHLQNVTPNSSWKRTQRAQLLAEISQNTQARDTQASFISQPFDFLKSAFSFILPSNQTLHLLKPAGALFSLSLLVLSSGIFTVSASQATLPGDTLYSIKLASERVQSALTTNEPKKAKLQIAFAGKRIDELEKIVQGTSVSEEEKQEQVAVVVTKFQENISKAQETLEEIKNTAEVNETVKLAQVIDNNVTEYRDTLEEVANDASDEVKEAVKDAVTTVNKNGDAALTVIAEKHQADGSSTYFDEVSNKVDIRLTELKDLIGVIDRDINELLSASSTDSVAVSETADGFTTTTKDLLIEQQTIVESTQFEVREIESLISEHKFIGALSQIKSTREKIKTVRELVDFLTVKLSTILETLEIEVVTEVDDTATSTDTLIDDIRFEQSETTVKQINNESETIPATDETSAVDIEETTAQEETIESNV